MSLIFAVNSVSLMLVGVNEVKARQLQQLCWSSSVVPRCTDFRRNRFGEFSNFSSFQLENFCCPSKLEPRVRIRRRESPDVSSEKAERKIYAPI